MGTDVAILDAEMSAIMGKLKLRPEHLLTADDTQNVFGAFVLPSIKDMQEID